MSIRFNNITKIYNQKKVAVDNLNLEIPAGSFVCFIGTSGSGKTTSMRMINKMVRPTSGSITIDDVDIKDIGDIELRRRIGYVIQQIGLFPHLTIYENIIVVCELLKWPKDKMKAKAEELMNAVDLPLSLLDKYPKELSGGMQQRVGVIRALAADQEIILMDEPFGALDPITKDALQTLVKKLQVELNKTIVFVTHDMDEALKLADTIVIMDEGKVVQQGTPKEILLSPANDFVRHMIGEKRLEEAEFNYMIVDDIMLTSPIKANQSMTVREVAGLMKKTKVDDIFIVDDQNILVGRVDLRTLYEIKKPDQSVMDIMKKVTYIQTGTTVQDALYYIQDLGFRNLSVVNEQGELIGLITRSTLVEAIYNSFWGEYTPTEETPEIITDQEHVASAQGDDTHD